MRRQALRLRLYSIHNGGTSTMLLLLRHVAMWEQGQRLLQQPLH
jgi:hypothetical protein